MLRIVMLCAMVSFAQCEDPITAVDYQKNIGWGFDTDFFKSTKGMKFYTSEVITDLREKGVTNLRLRSRADLFGFATTTYDDVSMQALLAGYSKILKDMTANGMYGIISWIHATAETQATSTDGDNFVFWWKTVATALKDQPYSVAFNLFTEIGDGQLKENPDRYNDWTKRAISAIRQSGGNNEKRIIILGAPAKDSDSLATIDKAIYTNQQYLLAEWHLYAGPNKMDGQKSWVGTGREVDRSNVKKVFDIALQFTKDSGVPTWIGAWMPYDNIDATLSQAEVEAFACYFTSVAKESGIPWSVNKLDNFYDTTVKDWIATQTIGRADSPLTLSMPPILNAFKCASPPAVQTKAVDSEETYLASRMAAQRAAALRHRHAARRSFRGVGKTEQKHHLARAH